MTKRRAKTIDIRQVLAVGLVALFSVVTVEHVARYLGSFEPAGEQWVGYIYAIGGDFTVAACALFTRWTTTKRTAWAAYFALIGAECVFNVCYIAPASIGAWIYSLYPTFIVAILSLLQRDVDKLTSASAHTSDALGALLRRVGLEVAQDATEEAQGVSQPAREETHSGNGRAHLCDYCGAEFAKVQGVSAHLRYCTAYQEYKSQEATQ
jgi:hypothetical protein